MVFYYYISFAILGHLETLLKFGKVNSEYDSWSNIVLRQFKNVIKKNINNEKLEVILIV